MYINYCKITDNAILYCIINNGEKNGEIKNGEI